MTRIACGALLLVLACGKAVGGELDPSTGGQFSATGGANHSGGAVNSGGSSAVGGSTSTVVSGAGGAAGNPNGTAESGAGGGESCNPQLVALIRDFHDYQPDFEAQVGIDPGIVRASLGDDLKPVFSGDTTKTVHSAADFDPWFHDVPGVNQTFQYILGTPRPGEGFSFFDDEFFPIDDRGFGNEGYRHNFHYTFELHAQFRYHGGETFSFTGNDDVFVFVNHQLVLDLGGVHDELAGTIDFDQLAIDSGLSRDAVFDFDFFRAQRHSPNSVFRFSSTLDFVQCKAILLH